MDTETNPLTHLTAEAVSDVACLDMTSIRALVVSENLDMSTGAGTLGNTIHQSDEKHFVSYLISLDMKGKVCFGDKSC